MTIAVFDTGKTNIKLSAVSPDGAILETRSMPNLPREGPPYRHIDLEGIEAWLVAELKDLSRNHDISHVVTTGHGSGGVLVDDAGAVMPMIDYEDACPEHVNAAYRESVDPFLARGGAILGGTMHLARQMLRLENEWPEPFARASHYLTGPQYWAFRLSGRAALEVTSLAAQSHLWDAFGRSFAPIVGNRDWRRLLPDPAPAWESLGPLRASFGLSPAPEVLCGIHDSSANFYRYQRAGLCDFTLVSTGTWIVGLADRCAPEGLDEARGMSLNADVHGNPVAGALVMGGREYALLAGDSPPAASGDLADLVEAGTRAIPSFIDQDGLFPGSANSGRILGPAPRNPRALALLYTALLTDALLDALDAGEQVILDGSFVTDPLFPALVAALRPQARVSVSRETYGPAVGAALLAGHGLRQASVELQPVRPMTIAHLDAYKRRWRAEADAALQGPRSARQP